MRMMNHLSGVKYQPDISRLKIALEMSGLALFLF